MSWIESTSASFACRHSSRGATDAARVLALLERTRGRLVQDFAAPTAELTVVLHDSPQALALASPLIVGQWALTARQARRYVAGAVGRHELHVLSPEALRGRASGVTGSFEMLALTPASLYARWVIAAGNRELQAAGATKRLWLGQHWAWLLEGAARWLSGETGYSRAVVGSYVRYAGRPHFPPRAADAPILAGTLIELLAERRGEAGVAGLVGRLHSGSTHTALRTAFGEEALMNVEVEWRSRLRRLADGL